MAREHVDTADILQDTVLRSLEPLQRFEHRRPGGLDAYLRQVAGNRIRDEVRKASRRPPREELTDQPGGPSPLEWAITAEDQARYERCLERLPPRDRTAITARLGEGLTYEDLARRLGTPTAGAARIAVHRAMLRLARAMDADAAR